MEEDCGTTWSAAPSDSKKSLATSSLLPSWLRGCWYSGTRWSKLAWEGRGCRKALETRTIRDPASATDSLLSFTTKPCFFLDLGGTDRVECLWMSCGRTVLLMETTSEGKEWLIFLTSRSSELLDEVLCRLFGLATTSTEGESTCAGGSGGGETIGGAEVGLRIGSGGGFCLNWRPCFFLAACWVLDGVSRDWSEETVLNSWKIHQTTAKALWLQLVNTVKVKSVISKPGTDGKWSSLPIPSEMADWGVSLLTLWLGVLIGVFGVPPTLNWPVHYDETQYMTVVLATQHRQTFYANTSKP